MNIEDDIGPLIPNKKVADDLGVCLRTIKNWEETDPTFPPRIINNGRIFRSQRAITQFKKDLIRRAMGGRANAPS